MKFLKQLLPLFLIVFYLASCTEDDSPIPGTTTPTSSIDKQFVTIPANGTFNVVLSATAGESPLNTLTIRKDGFTLDAAEIMIDGGSTINPLVLTSALKDGFTIDIDIATDLGPGESAVYTFEIEAENADVTSESTLVEVEAAMDPPVLTLNGDIIESNDLLQVPLNATLGSDSLHTIAVYENGLLAASNRLTLGAMTVWSENPYSLPSEFKGGFTETLLMSLPDTSGNYNYLIIVSDSSGLADSVAFSAELDLGTPVDSIKTNLSLLNSAGPSGTGGVNLITGESTGSNDASAHLADEGIDSDEPAATNWLQMISAGPATATLKLATGADYDGTGTKEEIEAIFNGATAITTSDKLLGGEVFVLQTTGGAFVLVRIDSVNISPADNDDTYTLSAKF